MNRLSLVAFAAASGRVGVVFLDGQHLKFWKMSTKAAKDYDYARRFAQKVIDRFAPDVVVTEKIEQAKQKGRKTKRIIAVITEIADDSPMLNLSIQRCHRYKNKYEEARELANQYPQLMQLKLEPRRFFDTEPRATVIFEALSLAESVKNGPATRLAAALG